MKRPGPLTANFHVPAIALSTEMHHTGAVVLVSAISYSAIWWFVLLLHIATAFFVLSLSFAHLLLSAPKAHENTSALLISIPLKRVSGLSYLLIAVMHLRDITLMLLASFQHRRLAFRYSAKEPPRTRRSTARYSGSLQHIITQSPHAGLPFLRRAYDWLSRLYNNIFGSDGLVGINGPFFTGSLLLRELIEIFMQSYQLWTLSSYVTRPSINRFAVSVVIANCWTLPIVSIVFRKREGLRRLMHLVVDMYLDLCCSVVIPVGIMLPYFLTYDWKESSFPMSLLIDDVWYATAVAEAKQVLVTSYFDYVASLLPQYSIFACLRLLKRLVHHSTPVRFHAIPRRVAITPLPPVMTKRNLLEEDAQPADGKPKRSHCSANAVSFCVAVWGAVVLGLHLNADSRGDGVSFPGCQLFVRPWLARNVSCSVLHLNCHRRGINGSAEEIAAVLNQVERSVLTRLGMTHCSALTIPSIFLEFPSFGSIEVFNSTLVSWPADVKITHESHPELVTVYITKTRVSGVPLGLLHSDLPHSLATILFFDSSIVDLPRNLGDVWATTKLRRVGFEFTPLHKIPISLARVPMKNLWMLSNQIKTFPDKMFANSALQSIRLSGNPLKQLPSTVGDTSELTELLVEHTNVSSLPSWARTWLLNHKGSRALKSFYGSPVCNADSPDASLLAEACTRDLQTVDGSIPFHAVKDRYPW